jgi:hypothetical protein
MKMNDKTLLILNKFLTCVDYTKTLNNTTLPLIITILDGIKIGYSVMKTRHTQLIDKVVSKIFKLELL